MKGKCEMPNVEPLDEEQLLALVTRMEKELALSMPNRDHPVFDVLETAVMALGDARGEIERRRKKIA
jgi:hypothetical protein